MGKGGIVGKTDDQLIQDLISIHNAENWLGMDGDVELSMFGNKNDRGGSGGGSTGSTSSGNSDCSSPTSSNGTSSSTGNTKTSSANGHHHSTFDFDPKNPM